MRTTTPKLALPRPPRARQRGAVLLVVMMVMMGLLGMGITAMWLTSSNLQIGATTSLRNQALYVAEAGIERARYELNQPGAPVDNWLRGSTPGVDEVPTAVDPVTGLPNGIGAILTDLAGVAMRDVVYPPNTFNRGGGTAEAPTSATMGTYTVWIRNDTAEARRGQFTVDSNTAVVVRSRGLAPDGKTQVVLEVTMGPASAGGAIPGLNAMPIPVLCNAGKNACEDNNSVVNGIVVAAP
jgi:Tfp pilus assembly protein PilX